MDQCEDARFGLPMTYEFSFGNTQSFIPGCIRPERGDPLSHPHDRPEGLPSCEVALLKCRDDVTRPDRPCASRILRRDAPAFAEREVVRFGAVRGGEA